LDLAAKTQIRDAHKNAAEPVLEEALRLVPRRSGKLAGSLRAAGTLSGGRVSAGLARVPYAGPIHFGWPTRPNRSKGWRGGPIRPNPFLYDALDARRQQVLDVYETRVNEWIRRAGLD